MPRQRARVSAKSPSSPLLYPHKFVESLLANTQKLRAELTVLSTPNLLLNPDVISSGFYIGNTLYICL